MEALHLVITPRLTEKSYGLSQTARTYAFIVPGDANKITVKQAVEKQFNVTVENVNMLNVKGKTKRNYRKGGRNMLGRRSDTKRAYITIQEGDIIPVFAALEEENTDKSAKKEKK